jgi:hypothetical protein
LSCRENEGLSSLGEDLRQPNVHFRITASQCGWVDIWAGGENIKRTSEMFYRGIWHGAVLREKREIERSPAGDEEAL